MERIYYIVVNNTQQGPFTKEELRFKNLSSDTLIWRAGMPQWVHISDLPEMADIISDDFTADYGNATSTEDNGWYAMFGNQRIGPSTPSELMAAGVTFDTPVWHAGMADWANASTQPEFFEKLNANFPPNNGFSQSQSPYPNFNQNPPGQNPYFSQNPQYGQRPNYGQNPQYGQRPNYGQNPQYGQQPDFGQNPQYGNQPGFNNQPIHTNWMPWAIIATVVALIFSCFGVIFGVIGIVQANKANGLYASGFEGQADQANNIAKIMTIIAFVLAGVGLITTGFLFKNISAFSYF